MEITEGSRVIGWVLGFRSGASVFVAFDSSWVNRKGDSVFMGCRLSRESAVSGPMGTYVGFVRACSSSELVRSPFLRPLRKRLGFNAKGPFGGAPAS